MLILGILSIFQIAVLPGYLAVRALRMDDGAIKAWVLSFTMSLVINHLLVLALVSLHIYYSLTVYFIFGIELAILAWMHYTRLGMPAASLLAEDSQRIRNLLAEIDGSEPPKAWLGKVIIFAAVVTLLVYILRLVNASHVFSAWDAVVSWNRWAVDWHNNQFPRGTHEYPQLLPSNWSVTYVFIGTATVQLFAKMTAALFPFTILLAVADLGLRSRNLGLILAVSTTGALLLWFMGDLIDSGYADIPVACMAFASVYMLVLAKDAASDRERHKRLFIGAVLCAGAALTKQPALYLAAVYPLLSFVLVLNESKSSSLKEKAKAVGLLYALLAALIAPWYVFASILMMKGLDNGSVLPTIIGSLVHGGRNIVERFMFAISSIEARLGRILFYLVIPLGLFYGSLHRTWQWLLIAVVVPWFFVWALLFSYDTRNLALVIPLVGVAAGIGLYDTLRGYLAKLIASVMKGDWKAIALLLLIAATILTFRYPGDTLVRHQLELQKGIGNQVVNRALYEYHEKYGLKGKIATDYQYVGFLPGLEQYYSRLNARGVTLEEFLDSVEKLDPAYLLWQPWRAEPDINKYVSEKINSGEYRVIFDVDGSKLIGLPYPNVRDSSRATHALVTGSSR